MDQPLLILSGMHGDESEVIGCVKKYLGQHKHRLPEFLYIPQVSPSAVAQKTRFNAYGHDINRSFVRPFSDTEVAVCLRLLSGRSFRLSLDFHEDPDETNAFYLYDTGLLTDNQKRTYRRAISQSGATVYTGIDDSGDETLGFQINNGYISTPVDIHSKDSGFFSGYVIRHHISKRHVTLEIPGKAPIALKQKLVAVIFDTIPLFGT